MYDAIIKMFPEKLVFGQYEIAMDMGQEATGMRIYTVAALEILPAHKFKEIWDRGSAIITPEEWEALKNCAV